MDGDRSPTSGADDPGRPARVPRLFDVGVVLVGPGGTVDLLTRRAAELLGADAAGPLPRGLYRAVEEVLASGGSPGTPGRGPQELVLDLADDVPGPVRCHLSRLGEDEDRDGCLVRVHDARLLDRLEGDLVRAARQRSIQLLSRGIAHDVRAPIHGMTLHLRLLRRSLETGDGDEQRAARLRWCGLLESELPRLERSFDRLVSATAPEEAGRVRHDLRRTVAGIVELVGGRARRQKVSIEGADALGALEVEAEPAAVELVVLTVAVNALEAMPGGGVLTFRGQREDDRVRLEVEDTGPGVPVDLGARIFDLHVGGSETGSGIGLYVARAVAEAEGGSLELVRTGADGSIFRLELPSAEPLRGV